MNIVTPDTIAAIKKPDNILWNVEEFNRFISHIHADIISNVWFIPLRKGTKEPDIPKGEGLKDPKYRLTSEQASERIRSGENVGIYAMNGGLLFLDADTDKGNIVLPEEIRKTIQATLTIKTRNGGLQYYFINNGTFKNRTHIYNGKTAGEIRADWWYVVAPGSYVKPDADATIDADGLYRIINDIPLSLFDKIPEGIKIKEDKPKRELDINPKQLTWKNDLGLLLYDIRKKDGKLDELLKGAHDCGYPSRSEADMSAAQKLYFWRFNDSEIYGILKEYRPYEKTARHDYLETTIGNINRGDQYSVDYHKKKKKSKAQKQINLDGSEVKNAIETGVIRAYKNSFELVEEFQKVIPLYYDISNTFWMWISKENYYIRCDDIDIRSNLHIKSGEEVWNNTKKKEIVECMKITGRRRKVIECGRTWIHTLSGLVDYVTGDAINATPEYFLTSPIPHKIGDCENIPTIDKLFTEWLGDRRQILYEWLAYNLVDAYPMHRMLILFGSGRNGKSQYTELLSRFIGKKNTTATELEKVIESRFEASKLYRKKSALIGETDFTQIKSSARIKAICGGDLLTAEYKNKDPFDFTNTAKITISTNNIPESLDKTEAFYSRCIIEEFKNRFDEGKPVIDLIPEGEYENLLLKCIKLLPALMSKGKFTNEGTIEEKAAKYERISNPWENFVDKELIDDAKAVTPVWVIYNGYVDFCKKNNYRISSKNEVTQKIKKSDYEVKKTRFGEKSWMAVFGLNTKLPYIIEAEGEENERRNVPDVPLVPVGINSFHIREKQVEGSGTSGTSGTEHKNSSQIHNAIYRKITSDYSNGNRPSKEGWDLELCQIMADHSLSMPDAVQYLKEVKAQLGAGW